VRLSGPQAEALSHRMFRPCRPLPHWRSHQLYLGHILDSHGQVIDEVLISLMRAPHSYTREDVVEINCHSGHLVLKRILEEALVRGARLARPGEFTLRAFLSGRLDLTQAEAVLEVIQARTENALRVATSHLRGGLARRLSEVREGLLELLARVEAALDFPEEAQELSPEAVRQALAAPVHLLGELCDTYREGRLLKEGLVVVIAGRPNVGKSSLLNRLLAADRAIVTEIPGTTRDVIEEAINLQGIPVRLTDTAGLREAGGDRLEELGMARTRERLEAADLVLYVVDGSQPLPEEDRRSLRELAGRPGLAVINKIDLPQRVPEPELEQITSLPLVKISALTGQGVADLKQAMVDVALAGGVRRDGEIITQARHHQHLTAGRRYLVKGQSLLGLKTPWELVAEELRAAMHELGEITGEEVGEDILDRIFSQFCIGK
jgi:tRNA modification GTPase